MSDERQATHWFAATSGRVSGIAGLVVAAGVFVVAIIEGDPAWIAAGVLIGLAAWMVLLRPRAGLRDRTLILRGVVSTIEIPLSQVTSVAVRQVLVVWVGERRFVNASIGRPLREVRTRPGRPERPNPYVDHLLELVLSHRADALRWGDAGGGVRRRWAVPELAGLAFLIVVVIVLALV